MSASREKKTRQEMAASGIPDMKDIHAAEEKAKQRRSNWLYGSIAVIFVVVAIILLVWNSNVIQRSKTAVSVDGEKYSAAEVDYFYHMSYNSIANSQSASYLGLDPSKPLQQQTMNDTAKMMLGIAGDEEMTFHQFFLDSAKKGLIEMTVMLRKAQEDGFTFTDEMQAEADETIAALDGYAKQNGMSRAAYLKALYGKNMTTGAFEKLLHNTVLVSYYTRNYRDNLTYTDDQIEEYYQQHTADFDVVDYDYIYFKGTAPATTDEDGKSVPATDEANAAAAEEAKKASGEALSRFKNGEDLEEIAKDYEIATYYSQDDASNYGDTMSGWLFDEARREGDADVVESNGNCYLMLFRERERNDYLTVNVRHILCEVDASGLDKEADDYEDKLSALKDEQKAKADKVMQEWKDAGGTEDAFAELAEKYSDDAGSKTNGGLYSQVAKGWAVPVFNDWIFDDDREVGDSDILLNEGNYTGYHVMYFSGYDAPYWTVQVKSAMSQADYSQWHSEAVKDITAEEHGGIKYVG